MGSTYPVPTNLVFLAALPSVTEGVKVRFLGWYVADGRS